MSFSRAHRRLSSGSERSKNDRHEIVGLSGWLFADLLLAVAVIFLVAADLPVFTGTTTDDPGPGVAPTVELSFIPELDKDKAGKFVWNESERAEKGMLDITIEIGFSEPVFEFGTESSEWYKEVLLTANFDAKSSEGMETGWIISDFKQKNDKVWTLELRPSGVVTGEGEVKIAQGAAVDNKGNENKESKPLGFFVQKKGDRRIDTENSSQITIAQPSAECLTGNENLVGGKIAESIEKAEGFVVGTAGEGGRKSPNGDFGSWVRETYRNSARIGFVFIYGPGADETEAKRWKPCVFAAFSIMNFTSADTSSLAFKTFKDQSLDNNQLKLELYFYQESDKS